MASSVRVVGPDLAKLSKQLNGLAPAAQKSLVRELRKAAEPAAADVRRAVLATPSKGGNTQLVAGYRAGNRSKGNKAAAEKRAHRNGTGLRAGIARATRVKATGNEVTILVDRKQLRGVQRNLPLYLEGTKKPWRHLSWGHDPYVTQQAHPYFLQTVRQHRPQFNTAAERAMRDAARSVGFRG